MGSATTVSSVDGVGISISSVGCGVIVTIGIPVDNEEGESGGRVVGIGVCVEAGVNAVGCDVLKWVGIGLGR